MEEKRESRRTRYTKAVIRQAFLFLMEKKNINKITVKEICETADVNRGTFYSYYKDAYDLLDKIEGELYDEIFGALKGHNPREVIYEIFCRIQKNSDLCKVLFSDNGDPDFLKRVMYIAEKACIDDWAEKMHTDDIVLLRYIYAFTAVGSVGIIREWIGGGMKESAEEMSEIVSRITYGGLGVFEAPEKNKMKEAYMI